jgi:hypothetical protein
MLLMIVALSLFGASVSLHVSAQQVPPQCPTTKTTCPDSVYVKEKLTFTAEVRGGDSRVTPTYNWTVSAGSIESGQGTPVIHVDTSEVPADTTVTATVDVGGFDRACGYGSTAASCTSSVMKKAEPRKLDEYGKLAEKEEQMRHPNLTRSLLSFQANKTRAAYRWYKYKEAFSASFIAEKPGFCVESILVLPNGKGNSSQQMGEHGREPLRKCVYVWRKP